MGASQPAQVSKHTKPIRPYTDNVVVLAADITPFHSFISFLLQDLQRGVTEWELVVSRGRLSVCQSKFLACLDHKGGDRRDKFSLAGADVHLSSCAASRPQASAPPSRLHHKWDSAISVARLGFFLGGGHGPRVRRFGPLSIVLPAWHAIKPQRHNRHDAL